MRTLAVKKRELDHALRIYSRDDLRDVREPPVFELCLQPRLLVVFHDALGNKRLVNLGAPIRGRLGKDRAQRRRGARVRRFVVVRESDGAAKGRDAHARASAHAAGGEERCRHVHELVVGDVQPCADLLVGAARALCGFRRGPEAEEIEDPVGLDRLLYLPLLGPESGGVLCSNE